MKKVPFLIVFCSDIATKLTSNRPAPHVPGLYGHVLVCLARYIRSVSTVNDENVALPAFE